MGTRAVAVAAAAGAAGMSGEAGLAGVPRLLEDLARLSEDKDSADIVFLLGRDETPVYAHRIILQARCKNFTAAKRIGTASNPTPVRMPHAHPETFRQFIRYIYTGMIILQDSGIFEMLGLAQELGIEELWRSCEEHVSVTLSPGNACALLTAALEAQERVPGVTQPTQHWTEEERMRVCQHLSGVINHVRLLLIDSQVFAEEVEPTGAVPIEMSLERYEFFTPDRSSSSKFLRYRYAALPNKYSEVCADKRLQPRVSPFLFPGSQILSRDKVGFQRVLNQWYGVSKQGWRLVYRASTHGYSAASFHRHCDNICPTYVIVLGVRGEICGGFSDVPWGKTISKAQYIASEKSFLFTLTNNQDIPPTKFDIVKKSFAICCHPDIGPIFGAGADLLISSNCNVNKESYSNLPHSYDGDHASNQLLMGDYHFSVIDYEVFTPSHPAPKSNH
ncbi:hypothetical protein P5V15_000611 [Pogonomyrmex californicus]